MVKKILNKFFSKFGSFQDPIIINARFQERQYVLNGSKFQFQAVRTVSNREWRCCWWWLRQRELDRIALEKFRKLELHDISPPLPVSKFPTTNNFNGQNFCILYIASLDNFFYRAESFLLIEKQFVAPFMNSYGQLRGQVVQKQKIRLILKSKESMKLAFQKT